MVRARTEIRLDFCCLACEGETLLRDEQLQSITTSSPSPIEVCVPLLRDALQEAVASTHCPQRR